MKLVLITIIAHPSVAVLTPAAVTFSDVLYAVMPIASLVAALGWLVQFFMTHRAQKDIESLRAQLQEATNTKIDATNRKREVYAAFISGMRVLIASEIQATPEEKKEFLRAYDESCLWASTDVATAIGALLDTVLTQRAASQEQKQTAYQRCIAAMRNECIEDGSPDFTYRFIRF